MVRGGARSRHQELHGADEQRVERTPFLSARTCSPARSDVREATFTLAPGDGSVGNETAGRTAEQVGTSFGGVTERVAGLVSVERLSAAVVALSMLAAFFWGAAHALTPGHGKAVVAAYLIGARGTARHAGILGLTVTLTHTAGVFILGAVTLYLSRYILPEVLYPWLSVVSGTARRRDRGLTSSTAV